MRVLLRKTIRWRGPFVAYPESGPPQIVPYDAELDAQMAGSAALFEGFRTSQGIRLRHRIAQLREMRRFPG